MHARESRSNQTAFAFLVLQEQMLGRFGSSLGLTLPRVQEHVDGIGQQVSLAVQVDHCIAFNFVINGNTLFHIDTKWCFVCIVCVDVHVV